MTIEDDYGGGQQNSQPRQTITYPTGPSYNDLHHFRPPATIQSPQDHASASNTDYSAYYSNPPIHEQYLEYPYGYDAYQASSDGVLYGAASHMAASPSTNLYPGVSLQTLHATPQQSPVFYDYSGAPLPTGSPFYYAAPQPMMYPPTPSPMLAPQLANPLTLSDSKRKMEVRIGFLRRRPVSYFSVSITFNRT